MHRPDLPQVRSLLIRDPEPSQQEAPLPEGAGRESCAWLPRQVTGPIEAMIDTLCRPVMLALPAEDDPLQFEQPMPSLSVPPSQTSLNRSQSVPPSQTFLDRSQMTQQHTPRRAEQQEVPVEHQSPPRQQSSLLGHPASPVSSLPGSARLEASAPELSLVTQPIPSPPPTLPILPQDAPTHGDFVQDTRFPEGIPPLPSEYIGVTTRVSSVREESTMQQEEAFQQVQRHPSIPEETEDESVANTARESYSESPSPTHQSSAVEQQTQDGIGRSISLTSSISDADSAVNQPHITDTIDGKRRGSSRLSAAIDKERRRISGVRRPSILPCAICFENQQEMAIDPCGHISMCHGCSEKVTVCPVCRGPISKALRVFLAGTG